jgi:hypothetical protein
MNCRDVSGPETSVNSQVSSLPICLFRTSFMPDSSPLFPGSFSPLSYVCNWPSARASEDDDVVFRLYSMTIFSSKSCGKYDTRHESHGGFMRSNTRMTHMLDCRQPEVNSKSCPETFILYTASAAGSRLWVILFDIGGRLNSFFLMALHLCI